jgi:hypothetical protein
MEESAMSSPYVLEERDYELITGIAHWFGKLNKEYRSAVDIHEIDHRTIQINAAKLAIHNAVGMYLPFATLYVLSDMARFLGENPGLENVFSTLTGF